MRGSEVKGSILIAVALVFLAWTFEPAWALQDSCCDEDGGCCETQMAPGSCIHCFVLTVPQTESFGPDFRLHRVDVQDTLEAGLVNPDDIWRPPAW